MTDKTAVADGAFKGCGNIKNVYYIGSEENRRKNVSATDNADLFAANISFIDANNKRFDDADNIIDR